MSYRSGDVVVWNFFASCVTSFDYVKKLDTKTIFKIDLLPMEESNARVLPVLPFLSNNEGLPREVVLICPTYFQVVSVKKSQTEQFIIELKETKVEPSNSMVEGIENQGSVESNGNVTSSKPSVSDQLGVLMTLFTYLYQISLYKYLSCKYFR